MKASVTILFDPKGRLKAQPVPFEAEIDLDERGNAFAFAEGRKAVGQLQRATVAFISKDGLMIRGFEEVGSAFIRQEWWVRPLVLP